MGVTLLGSEGISIIVSCNDLNIFVIDIWFCRGFLESLLSCTRCLDKSNVSIHSLLYLNTELSLLVYGARVSLA